KRVRHKRIAPEFEAGVARLRIAFESRAIHHRDVHAVRDGVAALDGAPGIELRGAEFFFLRRMPADARGIKNHLSALQRYRSRAFRVPLVPANLHADAAVARIEIRKAKISRREIKFLV